MEEIKKKIKGFFSLYGFDVMNGILTGALLWGLLNTFGG